MTSHEIEQIRTAIAALESQRAVLSDAVVDTALAPLRGTLAALEGQAGAGPAPDERKRVTILFADVCGYTTLSEALDPEDVAAIMNHLFEMLTAEITRFGGTVDKYSGDAVMALFGAPRALENHEVMAVRAALAMQARIADLGARIERERGVGLRMRIGLNTGEVLAGLVGGMGAKSYTVMGDSVNLAARLEHACPVGRVMVSATTARPLAAIFDLEPPQQVTVKGKAEPVSVCLVIGEKAEHGRMRGLSGLSAPMVGRDAELATLQATFEGVVSGHCWRLAAVTGEAGIGKTRLRREFLAWVTQVHPQAHILTARSYVHTQTTPYYLVAGLLRAVFKMSEDIDATTAGERLRDGLHALDPTLDEPEFRYRLGSLASVLGLALPDDPLLGLEPEQRRDRTFLSLERTLLAVVAGAPHLIVIEDLHWADALSLAFIERLVQSAARGPAGGRGAMLLALSRPPETAGSHLARVLAHMAGPPHNTMALPRLDRTQAGALVTALLDQSIPADLLALVVEHAQGNPFFVEEILRSFLEDNVLVLDPTSGRWRVTRVVADVKVPTTVQDVLAARLDRLSHGDKQIVQHAAIIGRTFWQRLLAEIVAPTHDRQSLEVVETALEGLEARQFVARLGESQIAHDWEWVFQHVLIQEVAYAGVLKAVRRRVHRQVAQWLEAHVCERTGFLIPLIAYHYERGDVPAKAVEYLRRAGGQAAAQFANADAVSYFSRAVALLEQVDDSPVPVRQQHYALLLGREGVYGLLGEREAQTADLAQLQALADEMDDDRRRAEVALRHAAYNEAIGDFPAALVAAQAAILSAERAGDGHHALTGRIAWGRALWWQGNLEHSHQRLEEALALAREQGDVQGEAASLHYLGTVLYFLGDCHSARDHLEKALSLRRALADRRGEATSLGNLVAVYDGLGDLARGKTCSQRALEIARAIGDRRGEAQALSNLASICHALGDLMTARDHHMSSLALYRAIGDRRGEALAAENLGLVLHELGDHQAARRYCEEALTIERTIGDRVGEGYSLTHLGLALEGQGELAGAAAAYEEALHLRRDLGQAACAIDDLAGLARVALKRAQLGQAVSYVEEALAWIDEHGVDSIEYPLRVYLTSADVLMATRQVERAVDVLVTANGLLLERAARISDEATRRVFLENVPVHRQIRERLAHHQSAVQREMV